MVVGWSVCCLGPVWCLCSVCVWGLGFWFWVLGVVVLWLWFVVVVEIVVNFEFCAILSFCSAILPQILLGIWIF